MPPEGPPTSGVGFMTVLIVPHIYIRPSIEIGYGAKYYTYLFVLRNSQVTPRIIIGLLSILNLTVLLRTFSQIRA